VTETGLEVRAGEVEALRLFEVAHAIELGRAEQAWVREPGAAAVRAQLQGTPAKAVAFDVPPLLLALPPVTLVLEGVATVAAVTARLYDFGVIVLALRVSAGARGWEKFSGLVNAMDLAVGPRANAPVWGQVLAAVRERLGDALVRPLATVLEEDYLIGFVRAFGEGMNAAALARLDLVPVLSGERRTLSEGARQDLLRQRFSYYDDDLVVLTWDRAFIYEPRGDRDVADVIEVANAQLLEMRYYDELLDDELPRMYDLVEATRRTMSLFGARRFAKLARRLYALVAEVTELTEKVDNALQVTEDVYLARIYAAALEQFRVPTVSAAVDRKLGIIRDTYAALYNEASGSRSALMELAILLLILIEIVLAVVPR